MEIKGASDIQVTKEIKNEWIDNDKQRLDVYTNVY